VTTTSILIADLEALIVRALEASNTSAANAASVARALTQAEIDGQKGHGLSRVPSYAAQARAGKIDGHATPASRRTRTATLMIDAANGFAYPPFDMAIDALPAIAAKTGIAAAGFARSHHFGVAGRHVERLAEKGLVALTVSNTPQAMAPWGGKRPVFGTNPIAFAAPRRDAPPLVIDMALSEGARGRILAAAQKGEPIPLGWAVDAQGQPTTDAKAALAGTLIPAGGAKGAALALMVETLAVALTGANFASLAPPSPSSEPPAPNSPPVFASSPSPPLSPLQARGKRTKGRTRTSGFGEVMMPLDDAWERLHSGGVVGDRLQIHFSVASGSRGPPDTFRRRFLINAFRRRKRSTKSTRSRLRAFKYALRVSIGDGASRITTSPSPSRRN
jgi:(2R)-3-sulfolactate dehydrogenase (NADP+)